MVRESSVPFTLIFQIPVGSGMSQLPFRSRLPLLSEA
jgi:hypothetical protein